MTEPRDPDDRTEPEAPSRGERAPRATRERTCIGCGEHAPPEELVRLVLGPSGEVAVDAAGGGFGRGAHVHPRAACLAQAASRGLMRATKGKAANVSLAVKEAGEVATTEPSPLSVDALVEAIRAAMGRRIVGLLSTAVRVQKVRIGSDAVTSAWRFGDAALVVVATDAAAAGELSAVREAVSAGAAVAWGDKQSLAAALLRRATPEGVAVAAITDPGIAAAVRDAVEKSTSATSSDRSRATSGRRPAPASGGAPPGGGGSKSGEAPGGSRRAVKVTAHRGGFRGKVEPERAGRASGRHLRRAQESRQ